ncbi:MAG: amidase family protein, partial [Ignavibacteria bacterium]
LYTETRNEFFGTEVKRRIMLGTFVLSAGYYDAYYLKAQKVRRLIQNDFIEAFKSVDLIISPTTPTTAFKIGEKTDDPLSMYLSDIYTTSANLAGIPAINVPVGFDSRGLPIGIQFISNFFKEELLFQVSYFIEKNFNKIKKGINNEHSG